MQHTRVYVDALGVPIHVATSGEPFPAEPIDAPAIAGVRAFTFRLRGEGFMRAREVLDLIEADTPLQLRWKPAAGLLVTDVVGDVKPI